MMFHLKHIDIKKDGLDAVAVKLLLLAATVTSGHAYQFNCSDKIYGGKV